jgi:ubiquinone/menaquinone biosynthesis C-methylase UbiE
MKNLYQKIAKDYDSIYHWKNYGNDVMILERFFSKFGIKVRHILDVACGTGNHDLLLARKGYNITGIDLTTEMLSIARNKVINGDFQKSDMKNFALGRRFDAVICLFSSISHNVDLIELDKTLENFYSHLKPNGICIFDTWMLKNNFRKGLEMVDFTDEGLEIIPFGRTKGYDRVRRRSDSIYLIKKKGKSEFCINSVGFFLSSEVLAAMRKVGFVSSQHVVPLEDIYGSKVAKIVERKFFVGIKV